METNILLTGTTGILGREVLYEFLRLILTNKISGKIYVLIRTSESMSSADRLTNLINSPFKPAFLNKYSNEILFKQIHLIESDIENFDECGLSVIKELKNLHVIHLASSTNLSISEEAEKEIYKVNYKSTINFIILIAPYIKKFVFVGTAFSCGYQEGIISNDYLSLFNRRNRNPYEEWKVQTGKDIIKICEKNKISWQILRPSIICGRLIEEPLYYIPKFNVFYAFGNFFESVAQSKRRTMNIRIVANPESGLNIVSSDYVAKTIARVFNNDDVQQLNIVNSQNVSNEYIISTILHKSDIPDYCFTSIFPENQNVLEKFYYKSVGQNFTPYLNNPAYFFDTIELRNLMKDVPEPDIKVRFVELYEFAQKHKFKEPICILDEEPELVDITE